MQRNISNEYLEKLPYKVTLCKEPSYRKNISFKRIFSHKIFANNVLKYLKKRKNPDIIYLVVPSLDVANKISKYANRNGIPVVLDIQDLWPEAFKMALNIPVLSNIIFYPMLKKANTIYTRADKIIAVSDTYKKRGIAFNKKDKSGLSAYIGINLSEVNKILETNEINKPEDEFWITYVGTLSHSYDINLITDAVNYLYKSGIKNISFKVIGTGPLESQFKTYAQSKKGKIDFLGYMEYEKMMKILNKSDIAVNPINKNSVSSIINKVGDYAAARIPVINTQNSEEYKNLLIQYNCGINCTTIEEVTTAIKKLYDNKKLRLEMSQNASKLASEKFNRETVYEKIVNLLLNT